MLLSGPPGLGKTTLAYLLAHEMGTEVRVTSGPALERKGDLVGILTSLGRGDVLFIDEIHRLQPVIEESLYPAMEDFRIELVTGVGAGARAIPLPIERFTLVGATTRTGQLGSPLLSRFGIRESFDFYSPAELTTIVHRSARLLGIPIDDAGADEIGRRARGTPRIANRLLRRIRDFADVRGDGRVTREVAEFALGRLEVDALGLDAGDRKILSIMIKRFDGGPVGIDSLAASLAEDRDTLEFVYEPYLIQEGFLIRTPRGRQVTRRAYEHLGLPPPARVAPRDAVLDASGPCQRPEIELAFEHRPGRAAHADARIVRGATVTTSVPLGRWTGVATPGARRSSRQAATTVAQAPVPHASVMPQPRSQTTRSISPSRSARELDVGAPREPLGHLQRRAEALGEGAEIARSSSKKTAWGLPIDTRGESKAAAVDADRLRAGPRVPRRPARAGSRRA